MLFMFLLYFSLCVQRPAGRPPSMASLPTGPFAFLVILLLVFFLNSGHEVAPKGVYAMGMPGGIHDIQGLIHNSAEIQGLARFAVHEYNKKQNAHLEFIQLLKAKEQIVAGKMYYLTLEAHDCGKKNHYEAKIWVKPWMKFMELQDFKVLGDDSSASQGE